MALYTSPALETREILQLSVVLLCCCVAVCRVFLWGVVWVVEKVCGVRVGVGGWRLMGFDSLSLRSHTYELVSTSGSETNT